jgi:hypothetical protein
MALEPDNREETLFLARRSMKTTFLAGLVAAACAIVIPARAAIVNFTYTQTDQATGSGTIAPFTFMGHNFTATPMPAATVFNPGSIATPSGFVGVIDAMAGAANEANEALGLLFGGTVIATSTDGYSIEISLKFVPKQTQAPDVNDYTWNVSYGDNAAGGIDAVGSALRFSFLLSRDDVIDATETPNTFQRYTQLTQNLVAGQDTFSNTDTTTTAIKDATDSGAPLGTDAAGRNLDFYFAWRDGGSLSQGAILVDNFTVSGLLEANDATLTPVPEPSSIALGIMGAGLLLFWCRRRR